MPEWASGDDAVSIEGQETTEVGKGSVALPHEHDREGSAAMPPEAEPLDAGRTAQAEETTPAEVEPEPAPEQEPAPPEPKAEPPPAEKAAPADVEPEPAPVEEAATAGVEPEPAPEEEPAPLEPEAEPAPAQEAAPAQVEPEPTSEEELEPLEPEAEPAPSEEAAPAGVEPEPAPEEAPAPLVLEAEPTPAEEAAPAEVEPEPAPEEAPAPLVLEAEPAPVEEAAPAEVEPEPAPEEELEPLEPEAEPAPSEEAAPAGAEPEPAPEEAPAPLVLEAEPTPAEEAAPAEVEPEPAPEEAPAPLVLEAEPAPVEEAAPGEEPPPMVVESEFEPEVEAAPALVHARGTRTAANQEAKKRRRLLVVLLALLAALLCVSGMFWRYLRQPVPLPELLPIPAQVSYPPHYLFSVYGIDNPVGVALSPEGDRIYVAETGGERLIRVFDRDGNALLSFSPPRTRPAERAPVYLAVDAAGRVYVVDRLQKAVFIHDRDGQYIDTILDPSLTLSEYVVENLGPLSPGTTLAYNVFESSVFYQVPGGTEQRLPAPAVRGWAPLGIRIDQTGSLLLTDVAGARHAVRRIPGEVVRRATWQDFDPPEILFGASGQGDGQFLFPNIAVTDSQGRIHVTDGNNSRICVWDEEGGFLFSFGQGVGQSALSLPRGAAIDARDRLHIVDAVEQSVKVYDVSGLGARYLFSFGDWGLQDGQFNYPNDIALDRSGRLYVADRENNRVQVWSY